MSRRGSRETGTAAVRDVGQLRGAQGPVMPWSRWAAVAAFAG